MIEIKFISTEETYEIRKDVLRKNISLTEKNKDDFDDSTFHLGGFIDDELVSVATFMQNEHKYFQGLQYRLRGMATLDKYQRKGLGKGFILKAEEVLKEKNVDILWCNARVLALNFYKKLGFIIKGSKFDITLIGDHYVMYKILKDD
ncbi:MAG: GNAT family N-acetyltransferase [Flavobacteriaceae bacterium]|nr:GNAT family N-acetyltransferase [Flavobacteriaceae bacterium]